MHNGIRVNVLQAVIEEIQLILAEDRVGLDKSVDARTDIFLETAHADFGSLATTANGGSTLEYEDAESRLGEVGGGDQTIVPGTRHHKIEGGVMSRCILESNSADRKRAQSGCLHKISSRYCCHPLSRKCLQSVCCNRLQFGKRVSILALTLHHRGPARWFGGGWSNAR